MLCFWVIQHATATARLAVMRKAKANVTLCATTVGFCPRRTTNVRVIKTLLLVASTLSEVWREVWFKFAHA